MAEPKIYMAGSVPRSFRMMRRGLFPPSCIIGTMVMNGSANRQGGATMNIVRDVVMMPARSFQSMKANASINLVLSPALRLGGDGFSPNFVFTDIREIVVPDSEPDPEAYAKAYFLKKFGIADQDQGAENGPTTEDKEKPSAPSSEKDHRSQLLKTSQEIFSCGREPPDNG